MIEISTLLQGIFLNDNAVEKGTLMKHSNKQETDTDFSSFFNEAVNVNSSDLEEQKGYQENNIESTDTDIVENTRDKILEKNKEKNPEKDKTDIDDYHLLLGLFAEGKALDNINSKGSGNEEILRDKIKDIFKFFSLSDNELNGELAFLNKDELKALLDKVKQLQALLKNSLSDNEPAVIGKNNRSFTDIQSRAVMSDKNFHNDIKTKVSKLLTEMAAQDSSNKTVNKEGGFRDLVARLTRLKLQIEDSLNQKSSKMPKADVQLSAADQNSKESINLMNEVQEKGSNFQGKMTNPELMENQGLSQWNNGIKKDMRNERKLELKESSDKFFSGEKEIDKELNKAVGELKSAEKNSFLFSKRETIDEKSSLKGLEKNSADKEKPFITEITGLKNPDSGVVDSRQEGLDRILVNRNNSSPQLNQSEIYEQIDKHIQSVIRDGRNRIEIQLEPESLGRVNLKLELENGKVSVLFNVDNNLVKDQLEHNVNQLRQSFLKMGYNVDHIQVETEEQRTAFQQQGNPEQHQEQSLAGQQQQKDSSYEGLSPGEIYQLMLDEERELNIGREEIGPQTWYQYRYGHLSINMNYLA